MWTINCIELCNDICLKEKETGDRLISHPYILEFVSYASTCSPPEKFFSRNNTLVSHRWDCQDNSGTLMPEIAVYRGRSAAVFRMNPIVSTENDQRCSWRIGYGLDERLETRNGRQRVAGRARRISRFADATAFHQHVILTGQGHWTEGNHQEQVRHVGLRALAVNHVAFLRSETTDRWERFCWVRSPDRKLLIGRVCANDSVA